MQRILVIEDEPSIAEVIREALTRSGHVVQTASDGRRGLQLWKTNTFDLVVTDMCMPELDGAGVVRHIRSSRRPLTPIIGMSGTPLLLSGTDCDAVLPKPFPLRVLCDAVTQLRPDPHLRPAAGGQTH